MRHLGNCWHSSDSVQAAAGEARSALRAPFVEVKDLRRANALRHSAVGAIDAAKPRCTRGYVASLSLVAHSRGFMFRHGVPGYLAVSRHDMMGIG